MSFKEGEPFNVFDTSDPDWILVGDLLNQYFGFVPANYIEFRSQQQTVPNLQVTGQGDFQRSMSQADVSAIALSIPPPPQHPSLAQQQKQQVADAGDAIDLEEEPKVERVMDLDEEPRVQRAVNLDDQRRFQDEEEDDAPPPMPTRPTNSRPSLRAASYSETRSQEYSGAVDSSIQDHNFDGEFFTWYIDEVDGRKKIPVKLSIGQGLVILKPNTTNPKRLRLRSASTLDNEWRLKDLTNFNNEKKHVFLEFKHPSASIELHAGSKDVANAITSILGDLKGAEDRIGLREVEKAAQPSRSSSNKKIGQLMYDFKAQGKDELNAREGDEVYILDQSRSKDWWMCESVTTGEQGVIPSTYIEIIGTTNLYKLAELDRTRSTKGKIVNGSRGGKKHRSRDERNRIREQDRAKRDRESTRHDSSDKSMPNFHRVRTWIDSSGTFKVEAEFLGCVEGKIHLHKTNGVKIAVNANKLSIEDLEYVEKVTGTSLEQYKQEVLKQLQKKAKSSKTASTSATAVINNTSADQPVAKSDLIPVSNDEGYDWFEFFLSCGVDLGYCQRYSLNFSREQMGESLLEDLNPSILRTLGLREGDILRVMKFLDNKFNRKRHEEEQTSSIGGLFTEQSGALKNNSSSEVAKVDASALPSPHKADSTQVNESSTKKFEDDAWAVKPAARSNEELSKPPYDQPKHFSGSLQDLVDIKPLDGKSNSMPDLSASKAQREPSAPVLTPARTGALTLSGVLQQVTSQRTGGLVPAQRTGGLIPVQRTSGLIPVQRTGIIGIQPTGGLVASQPTGFIPIQPTGFIPIQPTGFIPIQATGIAPQATAGLNPSLLGSMQGQRTGGLVMPPTTFNQPILQPNQTSTLSQMPTGNIMPQNTFGNPMLVSTQPTGGMPQTTFGQPLTMQNTASLVPVQRTGQAPLNFFSPTGSLQATGAQMPQPSFGQFSGPQQPSFSPQSNFGSQLFGNAPTSFASQQTGPNLPNMFQTQQTGQPFASTPQLQQFAPQTSFTGLQPQATTGQFQPQSQQPNMNQFTNMFQNMGVSLPPTSQFPETTFGQPSFYNSTVQQPLQSQPTGAGFGNGPSLQPQATGRKANLQAATPDNPFGFGF